MQYGNMKSIEDDVLVSALKITANAVKSFTILHMLRWSLAVKLKSRVPA